MSPAPDETFTPIFVAQAEVADLDNGIATLEVFLAPVPPVEWIRLFGHLRNVIDRTGGRLYTSTEPSALGSEVSWRVEHLDVELAKEYVKAWVALTNEEFVVKFDRPREEGSDGRP